jgi:hypothetical protein
MCGLDGLFGLLGRCFDVTKPRHGMCQGNLNLRIACSMMSRLRCAHGAWLLYNHKRLSATDISAHASMKNVAKCDTWCELQNPVNHRVFERKLRPKPFGRGHVCLGVTHRVAPTNLLLGCLAGGGYWSPVFHRAVGQNKSPC